jgi:hypothetical protein
VFIAKSIDPNKRCFCHVCSSGVAEQDDTNHLAPKAAVGDIKIRQPHQHTLQAVSTALFRQHSPAHQLQVAKNTASDSYILTKSDAASILFPFVLL